MVSPVSDALITLMEPDGYYKYLEVPKRSSSSVDTASSTEGKKLKNDLKSTSSSSSIPPIDAELIKKNYRQLSRKHHPDRSGGDAETFRLLHRAHKVLMDPKLRSQYDMLGIDLDDDEEITDEGESGDASNDESSRTTSSSSSSSSSSGIIQEIASLILESIMQVAVRTAVMGAVSVVISRYRITLYPALIFFAYIAYRIFRRLRTEKVSAYVELLSPMIISASIWAMHTGRLDEDDSSSTTWWFWLGEAATIAVFIFNSFTILPKTKWVLLAITLFSALSSLWLRGRFWNYVLVVSLQLALALLTALTFPIVEILLNAVLDEKLKKVGDRVRVHHEILTAYYQRKLLDNNNNSNSNSTNISSKTKPACKR